MNQAIKALQGKIEEITEGLPTAEVIYITQEDVIVSYQGQNVYADVKGNCEVDDILLVSSTYQVPAKREEVSMGLIGAFNHNCIGSERTLKKEEASLIKEYEKAITAIEKSQKKDFSIRIEVEEMLADIGLEMSKEQIDDVVEEVELYDTFLGTVGLFVAKGIKEVAERDGIPFDEEEIEHQFRANRESINYSDL